MPRSYKRYPLRFRERAVERMKAGENVSELARELGIDRTNLYGWKRKLEGRQARSASGPERDARDVQIEELEAKVARLEAVVGRGPIRGWWGSKTGKRRQTAEKSKNQSNQHEGNGIHCRIERSEKRCNRLIRGAL